MSYIVVRNNSESDTAQVNTTFFRVTGSVASQRTDYIAPRNILVLNPPGSFSGSAVVVAGQDVAVVVENLKSGEATNYQGITPSTGNGNAGWGRAGTTIYAPAVKRSYAGRTGILYIFNAGSSTATVTPSFRARDNGTSYNCSSFTIPSQGRSTYYPSSCGLPTGQFYGARLTSTQPLAVVVVEQNDTGATLAATSNAFSSGAQPDYVPLAKSDFSGNSSGIVVQNAGSSNAAVQLTYYDRDSSLTWSASYTIYSLSTHSFWVPDTVPAGKVTSARISGGQALVPVVYETKPSGSWRMQHSAFLGGSTTVILPRIYKGYPDGSVTWNTGIQVQNVSGTQTSVTVRYYTLAGNTNAAWNEPATTIQPNRSVTFYQPYNSNLPSPFVGSAVITSDQPLVAEVNVANAGGGDAGMSYSGFNR